MLRILLSRVSNNFPLNHKTYFYYRTATTFCKEFDVSQFCTVVIRCPYNINIQPIDVFKSQEKVIVELSSDKQYTIQDIQLKQDGDIVSIDIPPDNSNDNCILNVETSVKANLSVFGGNNDIKIGSFYGQFIDVKSNEGNISLSKSQCEKISLVTNAGNINCKDVTQAGDIIFETKHSGQITTDRLQGLNLKATTTHGSINIGSSYCDKSLFETDSGQLTLQNLHKNVTLKINSEALLNIVGLDGEIKAHIRKGLADIQIAKLQNISEIVFQEPSSLILRLSEDSQLKTLIDILSDNYMVSDTLKMECDHRNNSCTLSPSDQNEIFAKLTVKCENSNVLVDSASWSELLKASIKKRK